MEKKQKNISIEERLELIEDKLEKILKMVEEIHQHVGFVDNLSSIFNKFKNQTWNIATTGLKLLK